MSKPHLHHRFVDVENLPLEEIIRQSLKKMVK